MRRSSGRSLILSANILNHSANTCVFIHPDAKGTQAWEKYASTYINNNKMRIIIIIIIVIMMIIIIMIIIIKYLQ